MNEEEAFLRAICAEPDEDTPRLAFADWLDEHDRPERAEFIRVQCERARRSGHRERRTELLKRSMQLIQQFGRTWFTQDWPDAGENAVTGYTFDRGFVDCVSMSRRELQDADIARIVRERPLLALVHTWNLSQNQIGDDGLQTIANCPRLSRLRHLGLTANPVTLRGIEALAASPHLMELKELAMGHWFDPNNPDVLLGFMEAQAASREAHDIFQRYGKTVRILA